MYSKQEASQLRKEFWTAFGLYMTPVLSADGEKVNWINYKTGEKNIFFRMQANNKKGSIAIELTHPDIEIQQIFFEHFLAMKNIFESIVTDPWKWAMHIQDEETGQTISRIYSELHGVSIFKKDDWPQFITFFKTRIIQLDEFWSHVKYSFEVLR